jgi:hypothetical protein
MSARTYATWADRQVTARVGRSALTKAFVADLQRTSPTCKCCGILLRYDGYTRSGTPVQDYATLDRIRPDLGYAPWNVAVICFRCNTKKRNLQVEDVKQLLAYMEAHAPVLR